MCRNFECSEILCLKANESILFAHEALDLNEMEICLLTETSLESVVSFRNLTAYVLIKDIFIIYQLIDQ